MIFSIAIGSSLYIESSIQKLENHLDIATNNIDKDTDEVERQIELSIKEYKKSSYIFMMFIDKELCKKLLSELKVADLNFKQSHDEMSEAINNSKIILGQIKNSRSFSLHEII